MFHAFALGSPSQFALFCFPLWVFGTSNTMPLLGWIRVFTGRLSNLRPRIFLTVSWVNGRPDWSAVESSRTQATAPTTPTSTCSNPPPTRTKYNHTFFSFTVVDVNQKKQ